MPTALTPVYPTVAGLPQAYLRKAVLGGLARADLGDTFPPGVSETLKPLVWNLRGLLVPCDVVIGCKPLPNVGLLLLAKRRLGAKHVLDRGML